MLTLGFLYGYQNDPMIDIMIFRDSNKIELKNDCNMLIVSYFLSNIKSFLLVFL
jgi:hypothetical protein